jgi:hypothetical protein
LLRTFRHDIKIILGIGLDFAIFANHRYANICIFVGKCFVIGRVSMGAVTITCTIVSVTLA